MRKIKNALMILVLSVMAINLSSCMDEPEDLSNNIFGEWQLIEDKMGPVPANDAVKYAFYSDGTGIYGYYDKYGYWTSEDFHWDYDYGYNRSIVLKFRNGTDHIYYDWKGYDLVLSVDNHFNDYGIYRKVK